MRKQIESPNKEIDLHLSVPSVQNSNTLMNHQYTEAKRIVNNRMKGGKLQMAQLRQKQQLKTQAINSQNMRGYMQMNNIFFDEDYMGVSQSYQGYNRQATDHFSEHTKTRGVLTADPTIKDRRLKLNLNQQNDINRTMVVTSNGFRSKLSPKSPKRTATYFNSHNLDNKANDYMNLLIRGDSSGRQKPCIDQIHTEGMIPHSRKLNSFQRRMKIRKKVKSESKQKIRINLTDDVINLQSISKTLQSISHHNKGPLVNYLQHKTIFRKRSSKSQMRKNHLNSLPTTD